jgi:hypothetical protein
MAAGSRIASLPSAALIVSTRPPPCRFPSPPIRPDKPPGRGTPTECYAALRHPALPAGHRPGPRLLRRSPGVPGRIPRRARPAGAAIATSYWPEISLAAAKCTACWEDPHCRSTVVPGTDSGQLADGTAVRATSNVCSPTWLTQPQATSSTTAGSIPVLTGSASRTWADRSAGWTRTGRRSSCRRGCGPQ